MKRYAIISLLIVLIFSSCTDYVNDYKRMSLLIRENPINWAKVKVFYSKSSLQKEIQKENIDLNKKLISAIDKGLNNEKPYIQKQIISKDIQQYYFFKLISIFEKKNSEITDADVNNAIKYYQILDDALKRRVKWVNNKLANSQENMETQSDIISVDNLVLNTVWIKDYELKVLSLPEKFNELKKALKDNKYDRAEVIAEQIEQTIEYGYYLGILYEIEGIEANRGSDNNKVEEKIYEAKIFFDIAANYPLKSGPLNSNDLTIINTELSKNAEEINTDYLLTSLQTYFRLFYN